jgi:hypothetical protein
MEDRNVGAAEIMDEGPRINSRSRNAAPEHERLKVFINQVTHETNLSQEYGDAGNLIRVFALRCVRHWLHPRSRLSVASSAVSRDVCDPRQLRHVLTSS